MRDRLRADELAGPRRLAAERGRSRRAGPGRRGGLVARHRAGALALDRRPAGPAAGRRGATRSSCRPRAQAEASKPGPRLALVAGTRTSTRVAGAQLAGRSRQPSRPSGRRDADGVDRHAHRLDLGPASRAQGPLRVLQAVAGDRADDASAPGRARRPRCALSSPATHAAERRLDEDALACGPAAGRRRGSRCR